MRMARYRKILSKSCIEALGAGGFHLGDNVTNATVGRLLAMTILASDH